MPEVEAQTRPPFGVGYIRGARAPDSRQYSPLLSDGSIQKKAFRLGTVEPISATLLRELVGPLVVVAILVLSRWYDHAALSLRFLGLALVVFLVSSRVLSPPATTENRRSYRPSLGPLLLRWCSVGAVTVLLVWTLGLTHELSPEGFVAWFLLSPAGLLLANYGAVNLARRQAVRQAGSLRHVIIGATEIGLELAKRVGQDPYAGRFAGFFDFRERERLPASVSEQWIGSCRDIAAFVQRNAIDSIYIALPISTAPRIAWLLEQLRDTTASIYFVPNLFSFDLIQPRYLEIHGIPALAVCETPFRGMSALHKRAFDIALATLAVLLGGPVMLAIALAVKLTSRGPVLFRQRRYGLHGECIQVIKFRSMIVCEDGSIVPQATKGDQRITRLGRFLRRSSLDELPQVFNVLAGQMSFVGPRPHAIAHNEQYRKLISGYMLRHKVRPGMTGWAQVNGLRGETSTVEKMRERVEYDIDYVKNWSLWLDIRILARTLWIVIHDEHAY
ncbi:MAG TPA: undecaprenyl-phosphate glucose phosphotransferase [Steroidobacteraceae bacterium]|nr:undecaprenyl-phosphate glucose phosphotransferase [Steroidobacteraceae bacterium]